MLKLPSGSAFGRSGREFTSELTVKIDSINNLEVQNHEIRLTILSLINDENMDKVF